MLIKEYQSRDRCQAQRSLNQLMAIYEANYRRLKHLIPALTQIADRAISTSSDDLDLHLQIEERSTYTTILTLTYLFDDGSVADPAARIRIYHDARVAEVEACRFRQPLPFTRIARPGVKLPVLEWKWEINVFLEKWLLYCIEQGHLFDLESVIGQPAAG